ncbi:hypothetical protein [Fusobacterium sp. PH5-44]|uniref:hypothetical protein n=1 Tax=unclassified Fusobacterium TaxID=2648384 RepID=UPI003D230BB4
MERIEGKVIYYRTKYGFSKGIWAENTLPVVNQEYLVELDIDEVFEKNLNIFEEKKAEYNMYLNEDGIVLIGQLENIYDDGCACLRIGESMTLISTIIDKL